MRVGKLVAEQMKHAAGDVELARHLEVQQVIADQISQQACGSLHLGGGNQQFVVDQPVANQLQRAAKHHLQAAPLDRMNVVCEIAPLQRPVIDHRKMHEAEVR